MQLIFLGAPGAGKGTQAELLAEQNGLVHISTGDLLRQAIAGKTSLGIQAEAHVSSGELVPDILILAIMRERFGQPDLKQGWILDGFPRTISQAEALDQLLSIMQQPHPEVIYFKVDAAILVERMLQRGRLDDNQETIKRRLEVYEQETLPLLNFYQRRHCLKTIDGNLTVSEINQNLHSELNLIASV